MSRNMNLTACCKDQYVWKCNHTNEKNIVNLEKFNFNIRAQRNNYDSLRLVSEQSVFLNEKNATILKIGCSPQHCFDVMAKIETKNYNTVSLTSDELIELMRFLKDNFDENETMCSPYEKYAIEFKPSMKYNIELKPIELRTFGVYIGRKYITIDEESMNVLLWKKTYIENHVSLLKEMQQVCESVLIKLMNHFCYVKTTLKLATDASRSKNYIRQFFNEFLLFHSACVENSIIVIEIASNFSEWFSRCVPIFIKSTMLNEKARLESFSSYEWPHNKKFINVKTMAKTGLYFTGERDLVACAFCNVQIKDWKYDDDPVLDHHKYSRKCPFLIGPNRCFNIPIGKGNKVEELFSSIPKDNGYDEPDAAN